MTPEAENGPKREESPGTILTIRLPRESAEELAIRLPEANEALSQAGLPTLDWVKILPKDDESEGVS